MGRKRNLTAILLLGLLTRVEPVSAEAYTLNVSVHNEVRPALNPAAVDRIVKRASALMKKDFNKCNVEFKLGSVQPLAGPAHITDEATLEAVHRVDAHVKVVQKISFCKGIYDDKQ